MSLWDNKVHTPFDRVFDFDDNGELDPMEQAFQDDYLWQQWRTNNAASEDATDYDEFLPDDEEGTNEIEDLPGITREELACMDPADRRDFIQMNGLDPHMYESDEESALLDALEEAGYDMYDLMGMDLSGLQETLEAMQEEEAINFPFSCQEEDEEIFPFFCQAAAPECRRGKHPENTTGKIFRPGSLIYNEDEIQVIFRGLDLEKCVMEFFLINDSAYPRKAGAANIIVNEIIPERYSPEALLPAGSYQTYTAALPSAFLFGKLTDIHTISVKFVYEVYDTASQKMKINSSPDIFLQAGKFAF